MEFSVADLMDHGFDSLCLAHVGLDKNALFRKIAAAIGIAGETLNVDGIGGNATDRGHYTLVLRYIAGQLSGDFRQRFPLCLAYVEHGDCPKTHAMHPLD